MAITQDQDNVVRISIQPNRDDGGLIVTTAYRGWRIGEPVSGPRSELVDTVLRHLDTVMAPGGEDDEANFRELGPGPIS